MQKVIIVEMAAVILLISVALYKQYGTTYNACYQGLGDAIEQYGDKTPDAY